MGSDGLKIPKHWDCKTLVECTANKNISYGIVQPGQHDPNGIGIIRVNNFENGSINTTDVLKVSPSIESKFSKTRLKGGEVLLTLVGSTGQSAVVPKSLSGWNVPRAVAVIKPSDDVSSEWINICLQSAHTKHFLDARANTTVQKTLNLKDVKEIPIPLPPYYERQFLENIVVTLNNKITLNRQINQTLEQMAQALFKSWFVDFDPVIDNALEAGNAIPDELQARAEQRQALRNAATQQSDASATPVGNAKQLPDNIRQLFPNEFEESELGWVPKGWVSGDLNEVSTALSGYAFKSKDFQEEGHGVIKIKNIGTDKSVDIYDIQRIDNSVASECEKFLLRDGDLLMAMTGATVGKFGMLVTENVEQYYLNQRVAKLVPIDKGFGYLYCALNREGSEKYIVNAAQGSAQPNISAKGILSMPLVSAPKHLREEFNAYVDSNFKQIISLRKQSLSLIKLRDTLLPKLISGELRLDEVESTIEETMTA